MKKLFKLEFLLVFLLLAQALINLTGALGPELGFDALWYHLTSAKLIIINRSINPIPGNLLYWSALPRLGDLIYAGALTFGNEITTKLIHYLFGLASTYLVFLLSRRHYSLKASLSASLLFYSTLLVGWLSTTSYIDLILVTWLLLALYCRSWWARGLSLVLAGATKLHALVIGLAITIVPWGILGVLPFAVLNKLKFDNFFYPFMANLGLESEYFYNGFLFWLSRPLRLFFDPSFRLGPIILILFILSLKSKPVYLKALVLSFFIWFLGPGTGFGRFALFFLALLSINAVKIYDQKKLSLIPLSLLLLHSVGGLTARAWANQKYLPFILGHQTKSQFLTQNLKFHFGDFYDIDAWFKDNLKPTDKVLVYGIHNLYYIDFPFDHQTWANDQTDYTHILVGNNQPLPKKYGQLPLLYLNPTTQVKLYLNAQTN
jgi:hypothetical protein